MKYTHFLLITILLFVGCTDPPSLIPEKFVTSGWDFTKYSDKSFLFTPNTYDANYESIGLVQLTYSPKANLAEIYLSETDEDGNPKKVKKWFIDELEPEKGIDKVYNICIEMGADALTQMEIESFFEAYGQGTTKPVTITGIKISGFAIKRLGAFK